MLLDHCLPRIIPEKGQKKNSTLDAEKQSQMNVIACVSASGHAFPLFVTTDTKGLKLGWTHCKRVGWSQWWL